jgi:hypothetical protein
MLRQQPVKEVHLPYAWYSSLSPECYAAKDRVIGFSAFQTEFQSWADLKLKLPFTLYPCVIGYGGDSSKGENCGQTKEQKQREKGVEPHITSKKQDIKTSIFSFLEEPAFEAGLQNLLK